jgi:hypothetical protein
VAIKSSYGVLIATGAPDPEISFYVPVITILIDCDPIPVIGSGPAMCPIIAHLFWFKML